MRLIDQVEVSQVSGGVGLVFVLSFASGLQGFSFGKTVLYSSVVASLYTGIIAGIAVPVVGFPFGLAIGGIGGAIEGGIGYGLGSLFYNDPQALPKLKTA